MDNCIFAGSLADKYTKQLQTGEIEPPYDAIYRACLDMAEAKDNELAEEAKMALAAYDLAVGIIVAVISVSMSIHAANKATNAGKQPR